MQRIIRIVVGLGLIGYGVYSGNMWFYLGAVPLATGLFNWCPIKKMMGGCKDGECSTGSCDSSKEQTSCCSTEENSQTSCCSSSNDDSSKEQSSCCSSDNDENSIKILGTGCANCIILKNNVDEAVKILGKDYKVIKVEDLQEIMKYNVASTPAIVVNGEVKSTGKVLSVEDIVSLLK